MKATIIRLTVRPDYDTESNLHVPVVEYKYTVDGKSYVGNRLSFYDSAMIEINAQEIIDQFHVGEIVKIHYNPEIPQISVIDRKRSSFSSVVKFIPGLLAIAIGFYIFLFETTG